MTPRKKKSGSSRSAVQKFGSAIRYFRLRLNLSQEELADRCQLDRTYIGGIERGERNPSLKNIFLIANSLGISPGDLFSDVNGGKN